MTHKKSLSPVDLIAGMLERALNPKAKQPEIGAEEKGAQDLVNVKDVVGNTLYTKDGYAIEYIRVQPVSVELMTDSDKGNLIHELSKEIGSMKMDWRFYSIGRPIDITQPINHMMEIRSETLNTKRKELLSRMIGDLSAYATSSEIIERQFYFMLWSKADENALKDLSDRAATLVKKLGNCKVSAYVAPRKEVLQLCNRFANPNSLIKEADEWDAAITMLSGMEENHHGIAI